MQLDFEIRVQDLKPLPASVQDCHHDTYFQLEMHLRQVLELKRTIAHPSVPATHGDPCILVFMYVAHIVRRTEVGIEENPRCSHGGWFCWCCFPDPDRIGILRGLNDLGCA